MAIQRELSNQEELVHQLDPEPVFDYLLQHRALDQSTVEVIRGEEKLADRNIKLLQHLEELGNPAVELFINALRQSGQLHLASSLDVEHRIKPVYGKGYWEKQRYKGQIAISFQLVAAKVMVRKDSEEDKSPKIVDINAMLTPFKVKHSYENMTLIEDEGNGPKARKILEYSYDEEDEKKSCCWCCLPFFCCCMSNSRKKKKQEYEKSANSVNVPSKNGAQLEKSSSDISLNFCDVMVSLPSQPASPIKSGSTFFKTRKMSPTNEVVSSPESPTSPLPKSDSVDRNSNHHLNEALINTSPLSENIDVDVVFSAKQEDVSFKSTKSEKLDKSKKKNGGKKKTKSDSMLEIKNQKNGHVAGDVKSDTSSDNKENSDPLIMGLQEKKGFNGKSKPPKVSPPKSLKTSKTPKGMTRSETYELVERWKSEGRAYQTARDQFFSYFDNNIQSRIVRYFEQERSTLVLQISVDDKMAVCTICMTTKEVRKLREDYEMGVLHEELVQCVDPQNVVDKLECCAIHLRTVIDDEDFTLSYQELS
ncbi:uncharacterized protein LOC123527692 [Mercenaria mercenaria]|uniref:uncharacterized protein LOC123527692 n=1 Tax=Mercenaria mercenaria TaxID=6596 RepID=UPI00234E7F6E|nr:uncharacterized protein LOC123527692 [Mercenaria mercenaria]XP_045163246.2 uncharacterized protein LOC123527692 [Mercenaria mercenaria]XP_045163247.2 uncharacterized protein LOC123527692 [Mercenaria mercenaria]XP_045163249.2 uncharacterized protein LOC123527692 [Mercenaria mercenaria]XP_045163250.2 uncharacterized protein LOC123527692 [Mercenaria mercenaria]XP_053379797.1 uncharacterized protein LOC123527692 [Mercenaria mercenaria]XP_053379798.1 uncharacterized protein LOC123527692 [Mercen